jgi:hypothetical protein
MSGVKTVMEQDERKRQAAVQIYIRAGVLKRCDVCGELTEAHSEELIEKSYMIGNSLISKNDPLTKDFKNNANDRLELAAILKNLWTDFSQHCKCKRQAYED